MNDDDKGGKRTARRVTTIDYRNRETLRYVVQQTTEEGRCFSVKLRNNVYSSGSLASFARDTVRIRYTIP